MIQVITRRSVKSRASTFVFLLAALIAASLLVAKPAHAKTYTVTNTNDTGVGSLRQALTDANARVGADTIAFNIPGSGPHRISSSGGLPQITDPLTINGYSQPGSKPNSLAAGNNAVLKVELNGIFAGAGSDGLVIAASNSTVKGLIISGWSDAVSISGSGATNNKVQGNFIGTDGTDTGLLNNLKGVQIDGAPSNTVGGTTTGARNLISRNFIGVEITGAGATGNRVQGNRIGTDASGKQALGNRIGVSILNDAASNAIGGTTTGARNVISGNESSGVEIGGSGGNRVQGNRIGTDVSGTQPLGNPDGVAILSPNNTIGGTTSASRNVISANGTGVSILDAGATGNKVEGNFIGTNAAGKVDLGNFVGGVNIDGAPDNTIGGTTAGARNLISGNDGPGVSIGGTGATGNKVQGNRIGTDITGTKDLGNSKEGVLVAFVAGNTVGGAEAGARNVIFGNDGPGVFIKGNVATGNRILSNSINASGQLGIELARDDVSRGVTANDTGDGDTGPNNLQNFPVLTKAAKSGKKKTAVEGTLNSTANTTFTIQFFSSPEADSSGNGEGRRLLGSKSVTTDVSGNATFTATTPKVPAGQVVTATATNETTGDSSEFSGAVVAS